MTDLDRMLARGDLGFIDDLKLTEWLVERRWFGGEQNEISRVQVVDAIAITDEPPHLVLALIEITFTTGFHDLYQLVLGACPSAKTKGIRAVAADGESIVVDALDDPALARILTRTVLQGRSFMRGNLEIRFQRFGTHSPLQLGGGRVISVDQSNSSVALDDQLLLKVYRRAEAGLHPELEVLRFLARCGFPHAPGLIGWYETSGGRIESTLGLLETFVPGARDGWTVCSAALANGRGDDFLPLVSRLGEVTGLLHAALASDASDPDFAPEVPSVEAHGLLTASIEEEIDQAFTAASGIADAQSIVQRADEVRERLSLLSQTSDSGKVIRQHGDYHLGQVLLTDGDWVVVDFEGEPARPLLDRRRKRSPLRDVAGMLRSFSYVASAAEIAGVAQSAEWEQRARSAFLDAYLSVAEPAGFLPSSPDGITQLLAVFELEKAVYELRYEIAHRPDWVGVSVAGIERILASPL